MALPKPHRLRHRKDFSAVYQDGRRFKGRHFVLIILPSWLDREKLDTEEPMRPPSQIGISISQKVSKRAVVRNRIKRQLQGIFQMFRPRLKPGLKVVVTVRSSAVGCEYKEFLQELEELLRRAEVLDGYS
jgi:ribonuclease P protein component